MSNLNVLFLCMRFLINSSTIYAMGMSMWHETFFTFSSNMFRQMTPSSMTRLFLLEWPSNYYIFSVIVESHIFSWLSDCIGFKCSDKYLLRFQLWWHFLVWGAASGVMNQHRLRMSVVLARLDRDAKFVPHPWAANPTQIQIRWHSMQSYQSTIKYLGTRINHIFLYLCLWMRLMMTLMLLSCFVLNKLHLYWI